MELTTQNFVSSGLRSQRSHIVEKFCVLTTDFSFTVYMVMFNARVMISAVLCRAQICQKDRETHDADAITNLDSGGACLARIELQNTT